ncbi:MAG: hypothetical protein ACRD0Q_05235 [Acidimicrobiales bacterium]
MFVVISASYALAVSMHVGGSVAKLLVRSEEPSALGQGVSPVKVRPAGAGGGVTGAFDEAAVVTGLAEVAVASGSFSLAALALSEPHPASRLPSTATANAVQAVVRRRSWLSMAADRNPANHGGRRW